jgi:hypothetical protein
MVKEYGVSVRNAGRAVRLSLSCCYTPAPKRNDHDVISMIEKYIRDRPRHGIDKM